jgi:hypothetical protein
MSCVVSRFLGYQLFSIRSARDISPQRQDTCVARFGHLLPAVLHGMTQQLSQHSSVCHLWVAVKERQGQECVKWSCKEKQVE